MKRLVVFVFLLPWIIGFTVTVLYPILSGLWFSFCEYSVLTPAVFVGAQHYQTLLGDEVFGLALINSLIFAGTYLPLGIGVSLALALLLNLRLPALGIFRVLYFLPAIVPLVCLGVIWQWMLKGEGGLVNALIEPAIDLMNLIPGIHLHAPNWLMEPLAARVALIIATLWTTGNTVLIFLAALQGVPIHLYESAEIDGASNWDKYWHIAIPSISPVILFNVITGLIACLQTFALPYVLAGGTDGPQRSLLFLSTYVFQNAFEYWNMGYACAVAIILFLIVLILTLLLLRFSRRLIFTASD